MKKAFALFLAFSLYAALAVGSAAEDPIVVQVEDQVYRLSQVQAYWDQIALETAEAGYVLTSDEIANMRRSVLDSFVGIGVMETKYREFGLDELSEEQLQTIEANAQRLYGEYVQLYAQNIARQYGRTSEEALEYAETFMELDGITLDYARAQALAAFRDGQMLEYVAGDLAELSDEEVQLFYEENFVQPSKELYAQDIPSFERDVLYYGGSSFFLPAGYRYMKQIVLPMPEAVQTEIAQIEEELIEVNSQIEQLSNRLYSLSLLESDTTETQNALQSARARAEELQAEANKAAESLLSLYEEEIAQILEQLAQGEDFDAIADEYSADTHMPEEGYLVCAESVLYEVRLRDAVMGLDRIGDTTGPVLGRSGVHFLQYAADAQEGAVPLEGELKEQMALTARAEKQYEILAAYIETWKSDCAVFTDGSKLTTPSCLLAE
ncbi:MAG: peptidylprolyl isomerase [Eubacteriales bacterium]|nr:peptidylprolyl isomerase [Eubacteriales bacterium]